jgi:hypothetical protein
MRSERTRGAEAPLLHHISEETLLADIERRLVDEFPYVSPMVVDTLIRKEHARFKASRIRDFVPLFVEKRTRRELKHASNTAT